MKRSEIIDHLEKLGIKKSDFIYWADKRAFRDAFKIRGYGAHHNYGQVEIDAICNVVRLAREFAKAKKFGMDEVKKNLEEEAHLGARNPR